VAGQGGDDNTVFGRRGAGGAPPPVATSTIGKLDQKTMTYTPIINYPTSPTVSAATVAVQVGNEFCGDRVTGHGCPRSTVAKRQHDLPNVGPPSASVGTPEPPRSPSFDSRSERPEQRRGA
jgi:hypothetical protein